MSAHSNEPGGERLEDETGQDPEAAGVEIGQSEGEGSTFEPEEDPEGHAG